MATHYAYQVGAWIRHWLNEVDHHSVHSPFFFDFYQKVILGRTDERVFSELETLRTNLLENQTIVKIEELGAGSVLGSSTRSLAAIASTSISTRERAELYARIVSYTKAKRIVELGSCLGLTTLYLSQKKETTVTTFEGSPALANVSLTNYEYFNRENIRLIEGNIDITLPKFILDSGKVDFVLMDANHRYEPTIKYFNLLLKRLDLNGVVVIDDIHSSPEMERAWREMYRHSLVYGSVDLFGCGILFFDPALNYQHFIWPSR